MNTGPIAFLVAGVACCNAASAQPASDHQCFTTAETRDKIAANALSEPFAAMQHAADRLQAEALGARLCRRGDALVYEINLLRRDGRILRSVVDAKSGRIIDKKDEKKRED